MKKLKNVTKGNWAKAVGHLVDVKENFQQSGAASAYIQLVVTRLDENDTYNESDVSGIEPLNEQSCQH